MPTLPNMGLITPTLGGDSGTWDDKLNAALGLIDPHDHTAGKGVKITPAAMNINADLTYNGNGITALSKAAFTPVVALTGGTTTLFVNTADNELYWRNASGTNVKLTAVNSINTTLVGGIVGDYSTVGAEVAYDDANSRYTFKQKSPTKTWAVMAHGEVRIYVTSGTGTVYTGIQSTATASSFTIVLPATLPSTAAPFVIDNTGTVTWGAGFTLNTNQNIVISGTGTYKHGTKSLVQTPALQDFSTQAGTVSVTSGLPGVVLSNNVITYYRLPPLPTHARIINITVYFTLAADRNDCTVALYKVTTADPPTRAYVDTTLRLTPSGTAQSKCTGVNQSLASATYHVQFSNGTTTPIITAIQVDYDVP